MNLKELPDALKRRLYDHRLTLREASELSSVPKSTLSRIARGGVIPMGNTYEKLIAWLEPPIEQNGKQNTLAVVNAAINADVKLSQKQKELLSDLFADMYRMSVQAKKK